MNRKNIECLRIEIVLATFNGEKYLEQQLKSLLLQTHKNWRLLVSDDGSTDSTPDILRTFSTLDSRISIVNTIRQGGVVANFAKALSFVTSDYVLFCDQDDVWSDDKVYLMLRKIVEEEANFGKLTPILGFSDAVIVDEDLSIISHSFYSAHSLNPLNNLDYKFLIWRSSVYGCTVIFNAALYQLAMPIPSYVPMHDQWFALVATLTGHVFYMPIQPVLYRQHGHNLVGARPKSLFIWLLAIFENIRRTEKDIYFCHRQIKAINGIGLHENSSISNLLQLSNGLTNGFNTIKKIKFVIACILPYWRDRKIYATLFAIIFILKRVDEICS